MPRGMGFPAHVGATADLRSRIAAHAIWQRADDGWRRAEVDGRRTTHSRVAPSRIGPTGNDVTLLQISVDEELLASAGVDPAKAGEEFRVLTAAKLFELRRITLGQASRLAGLSLWEFIDALQARGISWSNLSEEQIEHDIRSA